MEKNIIVEGKDLKKDYDGTAALAGISFTVEEGKIAGFLGPNGAGKTTLIKLMTCTSFLSSGSLNVFGMNTARYAGKIKSRIGLAPQENNLDPDFTVYENLLVFSRYFSMSKKAAVPKIEELLRFVNLDERRKTKVNDLSGGMKRKLIIARALINNPDLIILDEPTTGLDPQARRQVWELVMELKGRGKTVILSTHYMEEAEKLCDKIFIMDMGKILVEGRPQELVDAYIGKETVEIYNCNNMDFKEMPGKKVHFRDRVFVHTADKREILEKLVELCADVQFVARPSNLEDLFIYLTGKELKE